MIGEDPLLAAVGENIAFARGQRGLSAKALAARIGVSKQAVCMWERGHAAPSLRHVLAVARALEMQPSELLRIDDIAELAEWTA
jgi:transcriptional regulator with XRE-family HTH domain